MPSSNPLHDELTLKKVSWYLCSGSLNRITILSYDGTAEQGYHLSGLIVVRISLSNITLEIERLLVIL